MIGTRTETRAWPGQPCPVRMIKAMLILGVAVAQFGCAYARLQNVLINERLADKTELARVEVVRTATEPATNLVIKRRLALKKGDEIKTDGQSIAILRFRGGTEVIVLPNSHVQLVDSIFDYIGELIVRARRRFAVHTEHATAGTERTLYLVEVRENETVEVTVLEGEVRLEPETGAWSSRLLRPFERAILRGQSAPEPGKLGQEESNAFIKRYNRIQSVTKGLQASIIMPQLVGMEESEARRVLSRDEGFGKIRREVRVARGADIGTVLEQRPAGGNVTKKGVFLVLVIGVEGVDVPDLKGQLIEQARTRIAGARLAVGEVRRQMKGEAPPNCVALQEPRPGVEVPIGSSVDLVVEEDWRRVPSVGDLSLQQARERIANEDLEVNVKSQYTGTRENGTILRLDPPAETLVSAGSVVRLSVEENVEVPDFRGVDEAEARRRARKANLQVVVARREFTGEDTQPGTVVRQSPPPGRRCRRGDEVELTLEVKHVEVPPLRGLTQDEARDRLTEENLRLHPAIHRVRTQKPPYGVVIRQNPDAGEVVAERSPVSIWISTRKRAIVWELRPQGEKATDPGKTSGFPGGQPKDNRVLVPDVVSWTLQAATKRLREWNLQLGEVTYEETTRQKPGRVFRQNPRAHELVDKGTRVNLVIAKRKPIVIQRKQLVKVPDVIGMTRKDAEDKLTKGNLLRVGKVSYKEDYSRPVNTVIEQNPEAGAEVSKNSKVDLVVSTQRDIR